MGLLCERISFSDRMRASQCVSNASLAQLSSESFRWLFEYTLTDGNSSSLSIASLPLSWVLRITLNVPDGSQ